MMIKKFFNFVSLNLFYIFLFILLLVSCNENKNTSDQYEAWNSGEIEIFYDNQNTLLLDSVFKMYIKAFPNVKPKFTPVSSRDGMRFLFNGKAEIVLQSRDFLRDEDSLIKFYGISFPEPYPFAEDALVFFTQIDAPIDTLNSKKIEEYFSDLTTKSFDKIGLPLEPTFVICEPNSSVFANFQKMVLKGKPLQRKYKFFVTPDSVKNYVANNKNTIGIGYFSQIIGDLRFKPLKIGFDDSTGKHIKPKSVHQAYIVQSLYPYIITHKAYLLEDRKNLALWFASFISKESYVQRYFKDYGLVPTHAKIVLIKED